MKALWMVSLMGMLLVGCATKMDQRVAPGEMEWGSDSIHARKVYADAMDYLDKGRQADAETLVEKACTKYTDCQRLWFLRGVLACSRFEQKMATESFAKALALDRRSVPGQVANLAIDKDISVEKGFDGLKKLIDAHPDEILLRWLYAMESTRQRLHVQEGADQFKAILKTWKVAPVMVHYTYATLLTSDLNNPAEALKHQQLAAELEPDGQTYQGVAYTLYRLKRYAEADKVYGKLLEMEPKNFLYWIQWGSTLANMGNYSAAADKFKQAGACNHADVISLLCWGRCLEELGDPAAGFRKYKEALAKSPSNQQALAYVAHAKLYGFGTACNFEAALKDSARPGISAIENLRAQVRLADQSGNPLAPRKSKLMMKHLTALGESGDPEAQYSLAMIYRHGIGVPPDAKTADQWLRRAAGNGHVIAKRMLNPPL